jgi:dolichol kinase
MIKLRLRYPVPLEATRMDSATIAVIGRWFREMMASVIQALEVCDCMTSVIGLRVKGTGLS